MKKNLCLIIVVLLFMVGCAKEVVINDSSGSGMAQYIFNDKMDESDRVKLSKALDDFLSGKVTATMHSNLKTGTDYALSVQERVHSDCLRIMLASMSPKEDNPTEKGSPVMSEAFVCLNDNIWEIQ